MKKSQVLGCLFLAVMILLPLAAIQPAFAVGFKNSIIDVTEGDPVWGRPILVMGENLSEEEAADLFDMLNIPSEDDIILLETTHQDVDRFSYAGAGLYGSSYRASSVLIQHQEPGSGIEVQLLNPERIYGMKSPKLTELIARNCGFDDVKIVIATPRADMDISPAWAGIYVAAQYERQPFRYRISTIGRWQGSYLYELGNAVKAFDDYDTFSLAVDDLAASLLEDREQGVEHSLAEFEDLIVTSITKYYPDAELYEKTVTDLAHIYELWQRTPLGDAARMTSRIAVEEGDELWEKPVLIHGGNMNEEDLAALMEVLEIPSPEDIELIIADRGDSRDLVLPDVGAGDTTKGVVVLIQNQAPGYGLDVRILSPDLIKRGCEQIYRMVALTEGIRDAKIEIITNLRKEDPGHLPMAGIVKAYLEHGHKVDKNLRAFVQEEFSVLYDLLFYASSDPSPDGYYFTLELFDAALEVIFDQLLETKAAGTVLDEAAVRELFESNLEEVGQLQFLTEEELDAVIQHFVDWSESDVALDVGPLHPGDADRPVPDTDETRAVSTEADPEVLNDIIAEVEDEEDFDPEAFDLAIDEIEERLLEAYENGLEFSECRAYVTVEDCLFEFDLYDCFNQEQIQSLSVYFYNLINSEWVQ